MSMLVQAVQGLCKKNGWAAVYSFGNVVAILQFVLSQQRLAVHCSLQNAVWEQLLPKLHFARLLVPVILSWIHSDEIEFPIW